MNIFLLGKVDFYQTIHFITVERGTLALCPALLKFLIQHLGTFEGRDSIFVK